MRSLGVSSWVLVLLLSVVLSEFSQSAQAESPQRKVKVNGTLVVGMDQGWSDADAEWFYNVSQGSQLVPLDWMKALKTSDGTDLFLNRIPSYGYIAREKSSDNPLGLPIGFVKDEGNGRDWLGMNCAACHTTVLESNGKSYLVDGAPTLADVQGLLVGLVDALKATDADNARFDAFAKAVLGDSASAARRQRLRADLKAAIKVREGYNDRNMPKAPKPGFGFGRVDAIGAIMNEVTSRFLDEPQNQKECNAPVSYPFLWDTPFHDRVQWNGSAPNTILDLGNLARNVGEVLGVFGYVDLPPNAPLVGYRSTVQFDNLREIELKLKRLKSPVWPAELGTDKAELVSAGKEHFQRLCAECHTLDFDRSDPDRTITAMMDNVGTDEMMSKNFRTRQADTGKLEGTRINFVGVFGNKFGPKAAGDTILTHTIIGTILGGWKDAPVDQLEKLQQRKGIGVTLDKYKARPLNGIWATAPYLHNGSVPTLRDVLKPASERPKAFWVGSRKFNAKDVGFDTSEGPGASKLDTSLVGNSNKGHEYGTGVKKEEGGDGEPRLKAAETDELIAFLKTL